MSREDDRNRDAKLAELLAELRPEHDRDVVERVGGDPESQQEYRDLRELAESLESAGRTGRAERDRALAREPSAADLAATREARRRHGPPPSPWRGPWAWMVLAAAMVLLAWMVGGMNRTDSPPEDLRLGPGDRGLSVTADPSGFRSFHWSGTKPEAGYFVVEIHAVDPATNDAGPLLLTSGELEASPWTLTRDEMEVLRPHATVRWELSVFGTGQEPVESHSADASR